MSCPIIAEVKKPQLVVKKRHFKPNPLLHLQISRWRTFGTENLEELIQKIKLHDGPIWVEVGAGVGWNAVIAAKKNPSVLYLAIEKTRSKFDKFSGRFQNNLKKPDPPVNLVGINADAVDFFQWIADFHSLKIDRLILLYPNPHPQKVKLRWLHLPGFNFMISHLRDQNSTVHIASNEKYYIDDLLNHLVISSLELRKALSWCRETKPDFVCRTHFERKYFGAGQILYEVELGVLNGSN